MQNKNSNKIDLGELYGISRKVFETIPDESKLDFRLEQVSFDKELKIWNCVISYLVPNVNQSILAGYQNPINIKKYERIFKTLKINNDKEVEGYYIFKE